MFALLFSEMFFFLADVEQKVITSDNSGMEPKCHNLIMNEMPSGFHIQADRQKSLEHSVPPYPFLKLDSKAKW